MTQHIYTKSIVRRSALRTPCRLNNDSMARHACTRSPQPFVGPGAALRTTPGWPGAPHPKPSRLDLQGLRRHSEATWAQDESKRLGTRKIQRGVSRGIRLRGSGHTFCVCVGGTYEVGSLDRARAAAPAKRRAPARSRCSDRPIYAMSRVLPVCVGGRRRNGTARTAPGSADVRGATGGAPPPALHRSVARRRRAVRNCDVAWVVQPPVCARVFVW